MKKSIHPLLGAAVLMCAAQASFAVAPATSVQATSGDQAQQLAKKGGGGKHRAPRAPKPPKA